MASRGSCGAAGQLFLKPFSLIQSGESQAAPSSQKAKNTLNMLRNLLVHCDFSISGRWEGYVYVWSVFGTPLCVNLEHMWVVGKCLGGKSEVCLCEKKESCVGTGG